MCTVQPYGTLLAVSTGHPTQKDAEPPPSAAERKPAVPGSRLGLSRERILAGALNLLDREGLDAFSMRRLAEELEVGTMTIYGYFRSRDELLDAVVDAGGRAIAEAISQADGGGSWKARVRELMLRIRQRHLEHPAIVELRFKRPLLSPGALSVTEVAMSILREAGFGKRQAAEAYRILFIFTFGFSAFGPEPGSTIDRDRSLAALGALPPDQYPTLVDAAGEASETMADQRVYELGLDVLLDGLERRRDNRAESA
jgi:AcrR family transcriptional regulator